MSFWRNNKNQKLYKVIDYVTNTTNKDDGTQMVLYKNSNGKKFVREKEEFEQKFEKTNKTKFE